MADARLSAIVEEELLSPPSLTRERLLAFAAEYAGSPLIPSVQAMIAHTYIREGEWGQAVQVLERLPMQDEAWRWDYALALTRCGYFDRAGVQFAILAGTQEYSGRALFFLGYLDYLRGDLKGAVGSFARVDAPTAERMGLDFYLAQIAFQRGEYSRVLADEGKLLAAAQTLQSGGVDATQEALRLLGESAWHQGRVPEAEKYLRRHISMHPGCGVPSAVYKLGVLCYDKGDYQAALDIFTGIADMDEALGQSALLYAGQASAALGDYNLAAIYLERAARMGYDRKVSETALYNYAAVLAEGGRAPFGSATACLEEFGRMYPDSPYRPAVEQYLATGYMAEKRWDKALECVERIKNKDAAARGLADRCMYELGREAMAAGKPAVAERWFSRLALNGTSELAVQGWLWLGDALYEQKLYAKAADAYTSFVNRTETSDPMYALGWYDLGYARYQAGEYALAYKAFDKALAVRGRGALASSLKGDAGMRLADCANYTGRIAEARDLYDRMASEGEDADYAMLQRACMEGVAGDDKAKARSLESMLSRWPRSKWKSQALYELASAYIAVADYTGAIRTQEKLERGSGLYLDSKLQLASAYMNSGHYAEALKECEGIVRGWPQSSQAVQASRDMQEIHSELGTAAQYLEFLASVPGAPVPDKSEVDRLMYVSAGRQLDEEGRTDQLERYITDYPDGSYVPDAMLLLADAYACSGKRADALKVASALAEKYPAGPTVLPALALKGDLLLQGTQAERSAARACFGELLSRGGTEYAATAYRGLALSADTPQSAAEYAGAYLKEAGVGDPLRPEMTMIMARALAGMGETQRALELLTPLAADLRSPNGTESALLMAEIYLQASRAGEARSLTERLISGGVPDADLLARAYMTLADSYVALGEKGTAGQYLQSLKENYPGDNKEIKDSIALRLKQLK